jgi:PKD repeat protein
MLSSGLDGALQWLASNQSSSGSYGDYREHWAASAAYALWLNNSSSAKAELSYSYLGKQLNGSSTWFWGTYGEADVPSTVLFSLASSSHLGLINATAVAAGLLQFQESTGGFRGYYDPNKGQTVTSSVDTDMALLGLINSNSIPVKNQTFAARYLLSLQNADGSFNLTSSTSFDPIYSLAPDPVSITALTVLTLKSDGFTTENPTISNALKFLSGVALGNFDGNGHVYSAAMSAMAFKAYDRPDNTITASLYIVSQQNSDGGFSDFSRSTSYPQSNALDTGWAAIALESQSLEDAGAPGTINSPPVASFSLTPHALVPTVGVAISFDASPSHDLDADQLYYLWTFGDGSSGEGVYSTHTYSEAGIFTVTLTAIDSGTNPGPLSNTKSLTITVQPTTVQKSSTLPIGPTLLWIVAGTIGALAIIGIAFYLGRRGARSSTLHRA